jgi:hypothetical protein
LTPGRAIRHDIADKVDRSRRDRRIRRVGFGGAVLGAVLTLLAVWTDAPTGSFGLVPEALVGVQGIAMGAVAVALAKPVERRAYGRAAAWLFLTAMTVATSATVVVALEAAGLIVLTPGGPVRLLVAFGRGITLLTVGLACLWLVVGGLDLVVSRVLGDRKDPRR